MQYQISSDNMEMTESMKVLTMEKFERIDSRLSDIPEGSKSLRVVLNVMPDGQFEVKVVANFNGKEYFTDETANSLEHALIECVDELVKMLEKSSQKNWDEVRAAKGKV